MLDLKILIDEIGDRLDSSCRYYPDHWHDVVVEDKRVRVDLSPGCASKSRLIYVFRNKVDGNLLIGKTDTTARKRLHSYNWSFNTTRSEGKKKFPAAVRQNPENFEWAILKECKADEDLEDWEAAFIIALNTIVFGYNQNTGKGGGTTVPKKLKGEEGEKKSPPSPVKTASELIAESRIYEFTKDSEGFFHANWSPTAKKVSSKVYAILLKDFVYTGKSDQELRKRASQHFSNSRATNEKAELPLYKELANAEEGKILLVENNVRSPERKEEKVRQAFADAGFKIGNVAGTGGGGASKARKRLFGDDAPKE